ncbi:IS66 family insertion sequence element accessory protein TnpA [Bacillus paramycoides]|uniref:IS66 family insertion sequence element accessory protein TnpA n=1 Tax=Bacillus paramycoides TaxID=2026194 RepID=UPI00399D0473
MCFFINRHLLKKEWETYIQDYKNNGLSKVSWCQKQNLSVHRFILLVEKIIT